MGLFTREAPVVVFDAVIDEDGAIWRAFINECGELVIDDEDDFEVLVTGAVVDGVIYTAWVEEDGSLTIDLDD